MHANALDVINQHVTVCMVLVVFVVFTLDLLLYLSSYSVFMNVAHIISRVDNTSKGESI